jgi:hypothetical protein
MMDNGVFLMIILSERNKKMNIDKESAMGKWFFWSLMVYGKFIDRDFEYRYRDQTNLCHFVRVVFVYAPVILLIEALFWGFVVMGLIVFPIYEYGLVGFLKVNGLILLCMALSCLVVLLLFAAGGGFGKAKKWIFDASYQKHLPMPLMIIIEWAKAKKQKICPIVKFS